MTWMWLIKKDPANTIYDIHSLMTINIALMNHFQVTVLVLNNRGLDFANSILYKFILRPTDKCESLYLLFSEISTLHHCFTEHCLQDNAVYHVKMIKINDFLGRVKNYCDLIYLNIYNLADDIFQLTHSLRMSTSG